MCIKTGYVAFVFLGLMVLSVPAIHAQPLRKYRVYGVISDHTRMEPLAGATVIDNADRVAGYSDSLGRYSLRLTPGRHVVIYSFLGYKKDSAVFTLRSDTLISVRLIASAVNLDQVTVNGQTSLDKIKNISTGTVDIGASESAGLPRLLGENDLYATVKLLPGVQTTGEGDASMYVRGGGADQNLILLDGATVYNPTHLLGFYSVFNPNVIGNVKLIKSGIPASLGNRISSVVSFTSKRPLADAPEVKGNLGLISSRIYVSIPLFKKRCLLYLSARKTYINMLLDQFRSLGWIRHSSILYKSGYDFYDFNGGMFLRLSSSDQLSINAYQGKDVFNLNSAAVDLYSSMQWGNQTGALQWTHVCNDRLYLTNRLTVSGYGFQMNLNQNQTNYHLTSGIRDVGYKGMFVFSPRRQEIDGGLELIHHRIRPNTSGATSDSLALNLGSSNTYYSYENSAFLSDNFRLSDAIRIEAGIRYTLFQHLGPFNRFLTDSTGEVSDTVSYPNGKVIRTYDAIEPRLAFRYMVSKDASVKVSYTITHQYVNLVSASSVAFPTDFWVPASIEMKPQQSSEVSMGFYKTVSGLEFSLEGYYRQMQHQVEFKEGLFGSLNSNMFDQNLIFGKGRAYGLEFLLRKPEGRITGWIGYTLSKTERSFPDIEYGRWFPAKYDRRHDLSFVTDYNLNRRWAFSAVFVYATGSAYTPVIGRYFIENNVVNQYGLYNSARMPDYNRLDLSATYTLLKKGSTSSRIIFSVYNVYNRHNALYIYPQTQGSLTDLSLIVQPREVSVFPILPSVSWEFSF